MISPKAFKKLKKIPFIEKNLTLHSHFFEKNNIFFNKKRLPALVIMNQSWIFGGVFLQSLLKIGIFEKWLGRKGGKAESLRNRPGSNPRNIAPHSKQKSCNFKLVISWICFDDRKEREILLEREKKQFSSGKYH